MHDTASLLHPAHTWSGNLYLGGWRAAGATAQALNPASGQAVGTVGLAAAADVARAAAGCADAQLKWAALPYDERAVILRRAATLIENHSEELCDWLGRESGSVAAKAQFEVSVTARCVHEAAAMPSQPHGLVLPSQQGRLSFCRRMPHGVVGIIAPFNFPLYLAMRAVAPALAVGNGVVLKPDPRTAICGGYSIARLFEQAGLPAGVLQVLPGDGAVGAAMCADPNVAMIQFTGSTSAGRKVGALAGQHLKKLSLELGGKNTLIVLEDADVDVAASNAAWGGYLHQGQICMSTSRLFAHEAIADRLVEALAARAARLPVGDPSTGACALGPLINDQQAVQAEEMVRRAVAAGATLRCGGSADGRMFPATVLDGIARDNPIFDEELFAPVVGVTRFKSDDDAVALANASAFGLSAAVISRNVGRALSIGNRLNTGLLHINDQTVDDQVVNPFGGRGASGNGASIGGPANWEEFTQWQWVTIKGEATAYPF